MDSNKKAIRDRYFDNRLILVFIGLFVFFFGLNCVVSATFNIPLMIRWVEIEPGHWVASSEFQGLFGLRVSLFFFELFFGWTLGALFCVGEEGNDSFFVTLWLCSLFGLPLIINYIPILWIWIVYSLIMILWGWILGKKPGFVLPIGKELLSAFKEEAKNIDVYSNRVGHLHFHGYSALCLIGAGIIIPFVFTVYFFISAL